MSRRSFEPGSANSRRCAAAARRAAVAINCADIPSNRIAAGLKIGKLRGTDSSDACQANYASQNEASKRFCPITLDTAVLQTVINENLSTGLPDWVPVVSNVPRSTVVSVELMPSVTATGVDVNRTLPLGSVTVYETAICRASY